MVVWDIQIVFLEWLVIQIVFLVLGHTNCISCFGTYRLYFLFWDIQIVFLEWLVIQIVFLVLGHTDCIFVWEYSGGLRPPPLVIQLYLLNGCLGHTDCISWLGVFGRPKAASPCNTIIFLGRGHTDVFVGHGGRLTYISRNE
jgi:uncharacterized membrane protein YtjA (UPF0391 family)